MRDGDWYIGYSSHNDMPGAALTFGRPSYGIDCVSEPTITFGDADVGDAALPGEDGIRLGRDYKRTATVTFELAVDGVDGPVDLHWPWPALGRESRIGDWSWAEEFKARQTKADWGPERWASEGVDMLRAVWDAAAIRDTPSRMAWLLHKTGGRTRRMYGRPRKFDVAHSRFQRQGYVPCVAEFVSVDGRFYDETEKSVSLWDYYKGATPVRPGRDQVDKGPDPSRKSATVVQAGRLPTQPVIVIHGPCKNPKINFGTLWSVQLAMTIAEGAYVTIDARSWARTVMRTAGGSSSSVADKLTRASGRLAEIKIPPGRWPVSFSYSRTIIKFGVGPRIEIRWRDAHAWW